MTETSKILVERRDRAVLITLNVPKKRNAIDREMVTTLHGILGELWEDESVTALVLTGAGDEAFAAGADIAQLRDRDSADALRAINSALFARFEEFPRPVIAAVRGYAVGGGCELAMACDLRVLGESAKMGQPEVKLGIIPAAGGTYRLPRLVGLGKARELIYTGRIVDAKECLRIGLANEVVADDQVVDRALQIADEIGENGALAVRMAKLTLNVVSRPGQDVALQFESATQAILFDSDDKRRRMDAFLSRSKKKD